MQRGFMYPLAAVLVGRSLTGRGPGRRTLRAWALVGAATSALHIGLERIPALQGAALCSATNPCSIRWVEHLGFVTIPTMALAAFLLCATLLSVRASSTARPPELESAR